MKGISPLIAAVLLIAFTMAIAGIMASWATTFSTGRLEGATSGASCIGALDLDQTTLKFDAGTVSVKIRNKSDRLNLTGLKADLDYDNPNLAITNLVLSGQGVDDPLQPTTSDWLIYDTGELTRPTKITVVAQNCPDYPAVLDF